MAQNALDGTPFSSGFARNRHNNKLKAKGFKPAPADPQDDQVDPGTEQDQPQDITQDPKAMQLVDELKSMGYTADDVAQAFDADSDQDQDQSQGGAGSAATSAASLQLPGMQ